MARSFIVGTAGHVDHGKSALVRALTGTDPDRLPEEKARGITIDLGFAHLRLPAAADDGQAYTVGIVDVPGHEDFIKNMVAGVGSIDLALIVVAADDGWMPQTEEHVQILEYLGVTRAVVALTKIDRLAVTEPDAVTTVRERLRGTVFASAPIVPTSVVEGCGLPELRSELSRALAAVPGTRDVAKPRLWVDRAFQLRGVGTVVTGTLTGGSLATGAEVSVAPHGWATRIRGLQRHGHAVEVAPPGARVAVNLADIAVGEGASVGSVRSVQRGDLITRPELGRGTRVCDVWLERSARIGGARPLGHGQLVRMHVGTAVADARLVVAAAGSFGTGESGPAQLRLARPLPLFRGDWFVLRDPAGRATLAGGLVIEPAGDRKRFHRAATQACLRAQSGAASDAGAAVAAMLQRDTALSLDGLLLRSAFAAEEIDAGVSSQVQRGEAVAVQRHLVLRPAWNSLLAEARRLIVAHHGAHPAQNGLPLAQLRIRLARRWLTPGLFEGLLRTLTEHDCEQVGAALKLRSHQPALPSALDGAVAVVRGLLRAHPLDPPPRRELAGRQAQAEALQFLIKTGEVTPLSADLVLLTSHYERARAQICRMLEARGGATVSELRQALGTSRRIIVPLLETLDRAGVTVRDGDRRRARARVHA